MIQHNWTPEFLQRLKLAIKAGEEHKQLTRFSIETGNDVLTVLLFFINTYKNLFYKVSLVYEILSGQDRKYFSSNNFRTATFQNVGSMTSTTHEGIYADVEKFIFEKGEIYFPEDPYRLAFANISIQALPKTFRREEMQSRLYDRFFSKYGVVRMERVHGLLDALYYYQYKVHQSETRTMHIPAALRKRQITTITQYDAMDLDDQIKIFNEIKLSRKRSYYRHRPVKVFTNRDEIIRQWEPESGTMYLYMSDSLYVLILEPFDNISLEGKPVKVRTTPAVTDAIYVMYDTEWTWKQENQQQSVSTPNLLTYCIVNMGKYCITDKDQYKFETHYFLGKDCVLKFLEILVGLVNNNRNKNIYAIAHNATNIEHTFIIRAITSWFEKSPNYMLTFRHVEGSHVKSFVWRTIEFRDSYLFIPLALSKIGDALKLDVQKQNIDINELLSVKYDDPNFHSTPQGQRVLEYARHDALVLAKAIIKFIFLLKEALGWNYLVDFMHFRSASSIIKWWLIDPDGTITWDNDDICRFRNMVFFGGRNECFFIGTDQDFVQHPQHKTITSDGQAYAMSIDVTSSYPYSMSHSALPGDIVKIEKLENLTSLSSILTNTEYIYGIYGSPKFNPLMPIPLIGLKQNNKLIFPNFRTGTQTAFMWDFEFRAMQEHIVSMDNIVIITFKKYTNLQSKISHLFQGRKQAKEQGNEGLAFVYKILMNSGYGSLGLNYRREVAYLLKGVFLTRFLKVTPKNTTYEGPNGFMWLVRIRDCSVNSKIFMASYITAFSRHLLWQELIYLRFREKAVLLYCDTDSIIFVDKRDKELYYKQKYVGNDLGSWKFEQASDSWEITTLKVYRLGTKIKYKGISVEDQNLLTPDGKITNTTSMQIWTIGRDASITVKTMVKKMSLTYTKGFVYPNGLVIPPIV